MSTLKVRQTKRHMDDDLMIWPGFKEHYPTRRQQTPLSSPHSSENVDTHTHICTRRGEDMMIKVYGLGAQINAIVLMAPNKYCIQTDYYNSRLELQMTTVINELVKVQSVSELIFISLYHFHCLSLAFCPILFSLLETH